MTKTSKRPRSKKRKPTNRSKRRRRPRVRRSQRRKMTKRRKRSQRNTMTLTHHHQAPRPPHAHPRANMATRSTRLSLLTRPLSQRTRLNSRTLVMCSQRSTINITNTITTSFKIQRIAAMRTHPTLPPPPPKSRQPDTIIKLSNRSSKSSKWYPTISSTRKTPSTTPVQQPQPLFQPLLSNSSKPITFTTLMVSLKPSINKAPESWKLQDPQTCEMITPVNPPQQRSM